MIAVRFIAALVVLGVPTDAAVAGIIFSSTDKHEWSSFVSNQFTTIGFTGDYLQFVTEQHAAVGVHFTDGDDYGIKQNNFLDGYGIKGSCCGGGSVTVEFDTPQLWIAANYLGSLQFTLYDGDVPIDSKWTFVPGVGNKFFGVASNVAFNKVVIEVAGGAGLTVIDDLHFGGPIPAPGVLGAFVGAAGLSRGGRRRTR